MKRVCLEILLMFSSFFLPGFLWPEDALSFAGSDLSAAMVRFLILAVPQILFMVYILAIQKDPPLSRFGIVAPKVSDLALGLLVALSLLLLIFGAGLAIILLPEPAQELFRQGFRFHLERTAQLPLAFLFSLVGAYREEVFFRAYLLTRFASLGASPLLALSASSLLFCVGHLYQGLAGLAFAFLQGLILGWSFLRLRSIHPPALAHAFYNGAVLASTLWVGSPAAVIAVSLIRQYF